MEGVVTSLICLIFILQVSVLFVFVYGKWDLTIFSRLRGCEDHDLALVVDSRGIKYSPFQFLSIQSFRMGVSKIVG